METVSVAFCFNNAYCPLASGAIASLIRHTSEQYHYDIYIVEDDITEQNKYLLKTLNNKGNVEIVFTNIEFVSHTKEDLSYTRHTKYTFARLFFPKIFPNLDKILYLDSDLIVTSDIAELFNQDLEGCSVAACLDRTAQLGVEKLKKTQFTKAQRVGFKEYIHHYDYFNKYLNLNDDEINSYFGAGVLLVDLKKAAYALDKRLPELIKKKYIYPDQDILNIIFKNDKKILNQKFNVFDTQSFDFFSGASQFPVIIHYNGSVKPIETMVGPMAYQYWEEVAKTPFYYPAIESFINNKIKHSGDISNDQYVIENLFYNLKRFNKIHRRRKLIRLVIRLLVDGKKYKKLKSNPGSFFADSKNSFIRFLGRYYN